MPSLALERHPAGHCAALREIDASVTRRPGGLLQVAYVLEGKIDRLRIPPPPDSDPQITVRRTAERLELDASIRLREEGKLLIGLSAVVEDEHGLLSYWALRHRPGKPDFHHAEAFALELDEVRD